MASSPSSSCRSSGRLHLEWTRLRRRPDLVARARTWGFGDVDDLDQVLDRTGYDRPPVAEHDVALRRLLEHAATDDLAARVAVQRLVPGLLAVVARRGRRGHHTVGDPFDELLGAAWLAVRTFDPSRRPGSLAAALVCDAEYRVFRAPYRRRRPEPVDPSDLDRGSIATPTPHPSDELAVLIADARDAGIPHDDLELVGHLLDGSTEVVAERLGVTSRTIRNRRRRVAARLRDVARSAA